MHVEPETLLEQLHRDEHAVRAHDHHGRRAGRLVGALRLHDRDAEPLGGLLRGRRADPTATSLRPIGPREHELDLVASAEPLEHGCPERRGSRDDDPHGSGTPGVTCCNRARASGRTCPYVRMQDLTPNEPLTATG